MIDIQRSESAVYRCNPTGRGTMAPRNASGDVVFANAGSRRARIGMVSVIPGQDVGFSR